MTSIAATTCNEMSNRILEQFLENQKQFLENQKQFLENQKQFLQYQKYYAVFSFIIIIQFLYTIYKSKQHRQRTEIRESIRERPREEIRVVREDNQERILRNEGDGEGEENLPQQNVNLRELPNPSQFDSDKSKLSAEQLTKMRNELTMDSPIEKIFGIKTARRSMIERNLGVENATCRDIINHLAMFHDRSKFQAWANLLDGRREQRPFHALRHLMEAEGWDVSVIFR